MSNDFERRIGESIEPVENPADLVENAKWIEEYKKRMAKLLPDIQKAKDAFIEKIAELNKQKPEIVIESAREEFRKKYIQEDNERLQRMEGQLAQYQKSPEYIEQAKHWAEEIMAGRSIESKIPDNDFVEIANILLSKMRDMVNQEIRANKAMNSMSDFDLMDTIWTAFSKNEEIEDLYYAWEEAWGDANALRNEAYMKGIPDKLLVIEAINIEPQINIDPGIIEEMRKTNRLLANMQESLNLQSLSHSNIKIRLKYDNLRFISAWKAADKETADMSFEDFCKKYLTPKGHSIDPKQLEDAWEGRNQFEQLESGKKLYEKIKKRRGEENVRNILESDSLLMRNRDKAFEIIYEVKMSAPKMKRSEIIKEIMHRLPTNYYSANRYMNKFEKQAKSN